MKTEVEKNFSDFFEKWMSQLEEYLQLLLSFSRDKQSHNQAEFQVLVNELTSLHKNYYTEKWAAAHEDVLAFFNPVWLSPFETALLWITGWKPSMVFRLLDSQMKTQLPGASLSEISEDQLKKIEGLRARIRVEEAKVDREMERQQVAIADRRMVELARLDSRFRNGGEQRRTTAAAQIDALVEAAIRGLVAELEKVMKMADCVRLKTLKNLLDVLNPIQSVDFLAAFSMIQIQMSKRWKKQKMNQSCDQ